jgi:hypothetical protein
MLVLAENKRKVTATILSVTVLLLAGFGFGRASGGSPTAHAAAPTITSQLAALRSSNATSNRELSALRSANTTLTTELAAQRARASQLASADGRDRAVLGRIRGCPQPPRFAACVHAALGP